MYIYLDPPKVSNFSPLVCFWWLRGKCSNPWRIQVYLPIHMAPICEKQFFSPYFDNFFTFWVSMFCIAPATVRHFNKLRRQVGKEAGAVPAIFRTDVRELVRKRHSLLPWPSVQHDNCSLASPLGSSPQTGRGVPRSAVLHYCVAPEDYRPQAWSQPDDNVHLKD